MERFQIYLTKEQRTFIEKYGKEYGIIAETGRTTGKPDKSAVVRQAIDLLMEKCPHLTNEN
jgi:hypothetical protein